MLIDVALPLPLHRTFTYEVDDAASVRAVVGSRVVVPFRNRRQLGVIVGVGAAVPAPTGTTIRRVLELPDDGRVIDDSLLALCRWIAEYYVVPLGLVLRTVLPAALTGAAAPAPAVKSRRIAEILQEMPSIRQRDEQFRRAPQQRAVFELLESMGGQAPTSHLLERLQVSASVLTRLADRGIIALRDEVVARDPLLSRATPAPAGHVPTPAQRLAIAHLVAAGPGSVALLHGVTGSGKTLVYLELLREIVDRRGQTAIVLVPEIALTPQTVDRFRAMFGDRVAVLHSALSDGERYDEWLALRRGEKRIVVGARSAVFAPLAQLGAIIVDEEHEGSYKQGESPRYHAREVALMRARAEGAVVVLGSATPSLESWQNAAAGRFALLSLPERAGGARLPRVDVIDRRVPANSSARKEPPDLFRAVIGEELEDALRDTLGKREQSILLLNRRGYASFVQCGDCGYVDACPNCSISLTYHRAPERLVCHYCQHVESPRTRCARCGGSLLRQRGLGTQQVERLLADRFVDARIARMDVDTTSAKWAHATILDRVGRGEVDILLGTQMIAKGLDFPNVTLVGVVDADVGINLPDFRASERCFQLLSQVAGRAGRGPRGGRVLIQTRVPAHHAVQCAVLHDYHRFVHEELAGRRVPRYPPFLRLSNVVFSGTAEVAVAELAVRAGAWLRALLERRPMPGITIVGPSQCPVERIKNRWRWHLIVKAERQAELTRVGQFFMRRFRVPNDAELRVTWDRDPVALL